MRNTEDEESLGRASVGEIRLCRLAAAIGVLDDHNTSLSKFPGAGGGIDPALDCVSGLTVPGRVITRPLLASRIRHHWEKCQRAVSAASFAACAVCFSLRAAFRVCHDFCSVFGFGFSLLRDSRLGIVVFVVDAMSPLSVLSGANWSVSER